MKVSLEKLCLHEPENLLKPTQYPNSKLKSLYCNLAIAHNIEVSDELVSCGWPLTENMHFLCLWKR